MNMIKIGEVVNVVGLRGELKIYPYSENKERFETLKTVYFDDTQVVIEKVRYKDNLVILKIQGVDDRSGADACRGKEVFMNDEDLEVLPVGTYYIKDILGFLVEDVNHGMIGTLKDVRDNGAQNLFIIETTKGGELLVPAVEQFFTGVDLDRKVIMVDLLEGMYED
jgi:16S rRNA processing protein RimM